MRRLLLCFCLCLPLFLALAAAADDPAPAGGPLYTVQLRYKIDAGRTQRVRLFNALSKRLAAAGFQKEKGLEGEELFGSEMTGTLPASALPALLEDPHVQAALLTPKDFQPGDGPVLARFYLSTALGVARQKEVADKSRELLKPLGFVESVGADGQESRRLLGRIPFAALKELLKDKFEAPVALNTEPGSTVVKVGLIKAAVVIAEPEDLKAQAEPSAAVEPKDAALAKVAADLRTLFAEGDKRSRVEVVLRSAPAANDPLVELQNAGLAIEGRLGPLVYGQLSSANLAGLAGLAEVSTVRLPQAARQFGAAAVVFTPLARDVAPAAQPAAWVRQQGLAKAVVVASDFRGFEGLVGKSLPKRTQLLDFTRELNADLNAEPAPAGEGLGDGTKLAQKLVEAGGIEELLLARIDAAAPFQIEAVAEAVAGKTWSSPALLSRMEELKRDQQRLEDEKKELRVLRRLTLDNFGIDDTAKANREKYRKLQKAFDAKELAVIARSQRLLKFQAEAEMLRNAGTVLVGLAWPEGYADLPGAQPTLRFFDPELLKTASWLQALPVRGGSIWSGLFQDSDGDGVMEFAADVPAGQRKDLNFLAWQPKESAPKPELPAGAVVQLKLQWQEAHDPRYADAKDDAYRQPLAAIKIVVLRQRDPSGKGVPADVFDLVGRSAGLPDRIENDPRFSIYQTELKFQVAKPGRYVVLIEGKAPSSIVPAGAADIKAQKGEIRPKLTAEAIDPAHRAAGRVVFESFRAPE